MPLRATTPLNPPRGWQVFAAAPHRMLYLAGVTQTLLVMLVWLVELTGRLWPGLAVWSSKPIGMSPYSRAITCDICHTDYGAKFRNDTVNKSWHPVRIIAGNQTLPDNTIADYGNNPDFIDCGNCHFGDVTAATPNLNPDVAPYVFAIPQTDNATDGYPNHDNTIAGYILTQSSWSGQNVVTAGTEPHLGLTYNKTPGDNNAALRNYALCFSCHDGSAGKTNRRVDVKTKYTQGAGHYYKASGRWSRPRATRSPATRPGAGRSHRSFARSASRSRSCSSTRSSISSTG